VSTTIDRAALRDIAAGLDAEAARWLVDYYYAVQDYRIQATGQERAIVQRADEGAMELVGWLAEQTKLIEREIQKALDSYSDSQVPGQWAKSIVGIGPVLAAGLLAHIDIEKAPTVGHIWSFAGLNPEMTWGKGEKRPFNAKLKVLCWKIADSFVKFQNHERDIYGQVYVARKALEVERNEAGLFKEQAEEKLRNFKIRAKDTLAWYEAGKLPPGRLDLRARRYAVKLFLAHLHHVMYEDRFNEAPPKPYILTQPGHVHFIAPPNWPMES
jgi:hypothetical protein